MLSFILCCAALFVATSALPTGAPQAACQSVMPGSRHTENGVVEQATANPWIIDVSDFDVNGTLQYTPGTTYTSELIR